MTFCLNNVTICFMKNVYAKKELLQAIKKSKYSKTEMAKKLGYHVVYFYLRTCPKGIGKIPISNRMEKGLLKILNKKFDDIFFVGD